MKRPPLESFFPSPIQKADLVEISDESVIKKLRGEKGDRGEKGEKGDSGKDGKNGLDGTDGWNGTNGINGNNGTKGERGERGFPGEEGRSPTLEELEAIILPLIPDPIEPKEIDFTAKELVEKINKGKTKITKSRIDGLDDIENTAKSTEKRFQNWISLGGARQTRIALNGVVISTGATTLNFIGGTAVVPTGNDGSTINYTAPSSGGGLTLLVATGVVNGSNNTFTFTSVPTYLVIDGAWYLPTDNNSVVQWSNVGTTITTNIIPSNSIWGF